MGYYSTLKRRMHQCYGHKDRRGVADGWARSAGMAELLGCEAFEMQASDTRFPFRE